MASTSIYKNTLSIISGIILINLVINLCLDIPDSSRLSSIFTVSLTGVFIGICLPLLHNKTSIQFTIIDIFIIITILGYFNYHVKSFNLWTMGYIALLLIYGTIRLAGRFNYGILIIFVSISVLILTITGYLQYAKLLPVHNAHFEITGPYCNPAIYAGMISLLSSILFTCSMHPGFRQRYKTLFLFIRIVLLCCLPLFIIVASRAAWIALFAALIHPFYVFYLSKKEIKKEIHQYCTHLISQIIILLFITTSIYGLYQLKPDSVAGRILIWKITTQMIQDRPLTGFGAEGFTKYYMYYQADYLKTKGTPQDKYLASNNHLVYNEPLRLIVEYGLVGLLIYLCFIYIVIIIPTRKDIVTLSSQSVLIVFIVWGLFAYPNHVFQMQTIAILALACLSHRFGKTFFIPSLPRKIILSLFFIVSIGVGTMCIRKHSDYQKLHQIINENSQIKWNKNTKDLILLEKSMQMENIFWMYYCNIVYKTGTDSALLEKIKKCELLYPTPEIYIIKGDILLSNKKYREAENAYLLAHYMVPSKQRARSKLAILYRTMGREEEAKRIANEILTEKVKVYGFETYEIHKNLKMLFENKINY